MGLFITLLSFVFLAITTVVTSNPALLNDLRSRADVGKKSSTYNTSSGGYSSKSTSSAPASTKSAPAPQPAPAAPAKTNTPAAPASSLYSNSSYPYSSNYTAPAQSTPAPPAAKPAPQPAPAAPATSIRSVNNDDIVGGRGGGSGGSNPGGPTSAPTPAPKAAAPAKTDAEEIAEMKREWLRARGTDGPISTPAPTPAPKITNYDPIAASRIERNLLREDNPTPSKITPSPIPTPIVKAGGVGDKPRNLNYMKDDYIDPSTGIATNSKSTCGDSEGFISGTYCSGGDRYVLNIETTQKAYSEYVNKNASTILDISDDQLIQKAIAMGVYNCSSSNDHTCQNAAIAAAQTKVLDEMAIVGKVERQAITETRTKIQMAADMTNINMSVSDFQSKYGTANPRNPETPQSILEKAGYTAEEATKIVSNRQILDNYLNPKISDQQLSVMYCGGPCPPIIGNFEREHYLSKLQLTPAQTTAYSNYYKAIADEAQRNTISNTITQFLTTPININDPNTYDATIIENNCKNDQACKNAANLVLLFTSSKSDAQVIDEYCRNKGSTCLNTINNRNDILTDISKYFTPGAVNTINATLSENLTRLKNDALNSYASLKSDTTLARETCGDNFGCLDRFNRESLLQNLNPADKIDVQRQYTVVVSELAKLIPQVIGDPNFKTKVTIEADGSSRRPWPVIGGVTITPTVYNHIVDINADYEHGFWVYRVENPKMTAENQALAFEKIIRDDPSKILEYSKKFDTNPSRYLNAYANTMTPTKLSIAENRQFNPQLELNAVIENRLNIIQKNSPITGLYENGKLLPWNQVSETYRQQVRDMALKDMPYSNYVSQCAGVYGPRACTKEEINQKIDTFITNQSTGYSGYLQQILNEKKGTATLDITKSNIVSVYNTSIDENLRKQALAAAEEKIQQSLTQPQYTYQGVTYTGPANNTINTSWSGWFTQALLSPTEKAAQQIIVNGPNDPKIRQITEQLANSYLNRYLVEETYTRGTGLSGALAFGALGTAGGGSMCVASGIGAAGSPACAIAGGIGGGILAAASNFVPILGSATASEIEAERLALSQYLGETGSTLTQSLYSNQGAATFLTDGSLAIGRSMTTKDNQYALLQNYTQLLQSNPNITTEDLYGNTDIQGLLSIQSSLLDAQERKQQIDQNWAWANVAISAATGGTSGLLGGQLATAVFKSGSAILPALGRQAVSDLTLFAGGTAINWVQTEAQFNTTTGNTNLLNSQAQIDLRVCENQKGIGNCQTELTAVNTELSNQLAQTHIQALITDTALQVAQTGFSMGTTAYQLNSAATTALSSISNTIDVNTKIPTADLTTVPTGTKFIDVNGNEHITPTNGFYALARNDKGQWISVGTHSNEYSNVILIPKASLSSDSNPIKGKPNLDGFIRSMNNQQGSNNSKLIAEMDGIQINPETALNIPEAQTPLLTTNNNQPILPPLIDPNQAGKPGVSQPKPTTNIISTDPGNIITDTTGTRRINPDVGYYAFAPTKKTKAGQPVWVEIPTNEVNNYPEVVLVPRNYATNPDGSTKKGIPDSPAKIANSISTKDAVIIKEIGGFAVNKNQLIANQNATNLANRNAVEQAEIARLKNRIEQDVLLDQNGNLIDINKLDNTGNIIPKTLTELRAEVETAIKQTKSITPTNDTTPNRNNTTQFATPEDLAKLGLTLDENGVPKLATDNQPAPPAPLRDPNQAGTPGNSTPTDPQSEVPQLIVIDPLQPIDTPPIDTPPQTDTQPPITPDKQVTDKLPSTDKPIANTNNLRQNISNSISSGVSYVTTKLGQLADNVYTLFRPKNNNQEPAITPQADIERLDITIGFGMKISDIPDQTIPTVNKSDFQLRTIDKIINADLLNRAKKLGVPDNQPISSIKLQVETIENFISHTTGRPIPEIRRMTQSEIDSTIRSAGRLSDSQLTVSNIDEFGRLWYDGQNLVSGKIENFRVTTRSPDSKIVTEAAYAGIDIKGKTPSQIKNEYQQALDQNQLNRPTLSNDPLTLTGDLPTITDLTPSSKPTAIEIKPTSRNLNPTEQKMIQNAPKNNANSNLTRELLTDPTFQPKRAVDINGQTFYLSDVIPSNGKYEYAVMYVRDPDTGQLLPRVLYKSNSDGGWRSTPGAKYNGYSEQYSKGKSIHYTQETKPHYLISKTLENSPNTPVYLGDVVRDFFPINNPNKNNLNDNYPQIFTYNQEVSRYDDNGTLSSAQYFTPGTYSYENAKSYGKNYANTPINFSYEFANLDYPRGFVPDFSRKPVSTYTIEHTLLGSTTIEIYRGKLNGRTVEWAMARDTQGRVWIDSIYFPDSPITTYGTRAEIIDTGALTNKPLEYASQTDLLNPGTDYKGFNGTYVDITPLLDNLLPIKQYRESLTNRNTDTQTPKSPITIPNQKNIANDPQPISNTNQTPTRPNSTIEDIRRNISSAFSAGIEMATTKIGQFISNTGNRLKTSTTPKPKSDITTQHIVSPLNLPETETINRLTSGKPVILYHRLNSPEDLASIQQNGYQHDGWRTTLNNGQTTDVMYLSTTPPKDNDPNNIVLQTPEGLKIFDGRNTDSRNWTAASLSDGSFNGTKYDGYILETSSTKANSNIEVVIIKPNSLDLQNNLKPLSAVQKNRQSPAPELTPTTPKTNTLGGNSITKFIGQVSDWLYSKFSQPETPTNTNSTKTPQLPKSESTTSPPQISTSSESNTPNIVQNISNNIKNNANIVAAKLGQLSDLLYRNLSQSSPDSQSQIGTKSKEPITITVNNLSGIPHDSNLEIKSITTSSGKKISNIKILDPGSLSLILTGTDQQGNMVAIKLFRELPKIENTPLGYLPDANINQINILKNNPGNPETSPLPKFHDIIADNNGRIIGYSMEYINGVTFGQLMEAQKGNLTPTQIKQIKSAINQYHQETGQVHGDLATTDGPYPLHRGNIIFTGDPNRPVVLLDPSPGIAGPKTMNPADENALMDMKLLFIPVTTEDQLPILINDIPSKKSTTEPSPVTNITPNQKPENLSQADTAAPSNINVGIISSVIAAISAVGTAISAAINQATSPQYSNIPQLTPTAIVSPTLSPQTEQPPSEYAYTGLQNQSGGLPAASGNNPNTIQNKPEEIMPAALPEKTTEQITRDIINETININPYFGFPVERYRQIKSDGIITDAEREELNRNYYTPSPYTFIAHGTRLTNKESTYTQVKWVGEVIREQMNGGFVLIGSGQFGYHDELKDILPSWTPTSVYARNKNPNNILLDSTGSTVYYYEREKNYLNSSFRPISYNELTPEQKRLYDISNPANGPISNHFTTPEVQSRMTPQEALDSNKYVGAIATKSPNDVGKEILLFKIDPVTKESSFAGVAIVTDVARRADWSGFGGTTETITGQENANFSTFPLATRINNNGIQWGFDLDNDLYAYMGGTGGPTQPIMGIDAERYTQEISDLKISTN